MKLIRSTIVLAAVSTAIISCKKETMADPNPVPPAPPAPVSKIEAVMKFDGNLIDSTGKTTGTPFGTVGYATDRKGNANGALQLDGGSKVTFANLKINGKAFTMSAWIKSSGNGGLHVIASALNQSEGGPALTMVSNTPSCSVSTPGTNSATSNNPVDNGWHHMAFTYDGVDIKLYVDGVLEATTNHPGTMGNSSRDLVIGFFLNTYWKGYIDDLRVYNEVKPLAELQKMAAQ